MSSKHREILLNQTKIRLYLPFSDWFGSKRKYVWIQINWKMVNTIWFRLDLMRFGKRFPRALHTKSQKSAHAELVSYLTSTPSRENLHPTLYEFSCNVCIYSGFYCYICRVWRMYEFIEGLWMFMNFVSYRFLYLTSTPSRENLHWVCNISY